MNKNKYKRIIAGIIDLYIASIFSYFIIAIFTNGTFEANTMTIFIYIITLSIAIISKDIIFKNQSIGKKIFKIVIKDCNKQTIVPKKEKLVLRNIILVILFPLEFLMIFLFNERFGDILLSTKIVNKNYT